jgi:L-erythro-3,5-diaminohexanoate dehydrogenase
MFVGRIRSIGTQISTSHGVGEIVASLTSLTLTPLALTSIDRVHLGTGQIDVKGHAILFERSPFTTVPSDFTPTMALALFDVAGAPAQVHRLAKAAQHVCVIGADGKSGILSCVAARDRLGPAARISGVVLSIESPGSKLLIELGYVDELHEVDARNAVKMFECVVANGNLPDLVVNCVNVPGTEMGSVLSCKDGGTVLFFSMATSFTAAALGAEGVSKDVAMHIGSGYVPGHADFAADLLRRNRSVFDYFEMRFGSS